MNEILIAITLSFSMEFRQPIPEITFKLIPMDTIYGRADKVGKVWQITLDSITAVAIKPDQLKTLVYHELAHITLSLPDTRRRRDMMNPTYCIAPYRRLKHWYE